jgi:putative endonuclease
MDSLRAYRNDNKLIKSEKASYIAMNWQVYIIFCSDASYYTGITTDLAKRYRQHESGQGAKYFRGRRPERIVYLETEHTRSSASKREIAIKKLSREQKIELTLSGWAADPLKMAKLLAV